MLEGITILNQTEIMTGPEWTQIAITISLVLIVIFLLATMLSVICNAKDKICYIIFLLAILSLIAIIFFTILNEKIKISTEKYEYQVTIDDSVSFNEFNERYEIIDIDGKIYTIREKEITD